MKSFLAVCYMIVFSIALQSQAWESQAHFINHPDLYRDGVHVTASVDLSQLHPKQSVHLISNPQMIEFTPASSTLIIGKTQWMGIDNKSLTRTIYNNFATFGKFEAYNTWPVLQWGFRF